ncbi:MAG: hypothetical protein WKG01_13580 [Kofleriaceae bacterium]
MILRAVLIVAFGLGVAEAAPRLSITVEPRAVPAELSRVIYLERCRGGCTVIGDSVTDATALRSTIPPTGPHTISEFENAAGVRGAPADAEWAAVVACVREVYSPYDVLVTDQKPASGTYHAAIVAGLPSQIGYGQDVLGIAPIANDCSAQDNVVSFSFANQHGPSDRIENLCWTVTQESSHAFGLDHTIAFLDGSSTCNDPTTYQTDCGGRKFFRNAHATCGEYTARECKCGGKQNAHDKLASVFGLGIPLTPRPTSTLVSPVAGGPFLAEAGSRRGVDRVTLRLNGAPWAELPGVAFGAAGQPDPARYRLELPAGVPDGIIDVTVRAADDLGTFTDSAAFTFTKGVPCTSADSCLAYQRCTEGRCAWDPPVGQLGDSCEYPQFCESNLCRGSTETQICTIECDPEGADCPSGYSCARAGDDHVCFIESGGGCCSTSRTGAAWPAFAICALVLGFITRRRTA